MNECFDEWIAWVQCQGAVNMENTKAMLPFYFASDLLLFITSKYKYHNVLFVNQI